MDFSPAFNTISHDILANKTCLILWVSDFFGTRILGQSVTSLSDKLTTSTDFPQGYVLFPSLSILYTSSCTSTFLKMYFIKHLDDTNSQNLLHVEEEERGPVLFHFLKTCIWIGPMP